MDASQRDHSGVMEEIICGIEAHLAGPPFPSDETLRLQALHSLRMLDTPGEERFDRIVRLVTQCFETPLAAVSLVDADRQWFKSRVGMPFDQTPRRISMCGHAILQNQVMVVPDARKDMRFASSPLVVNDPMVRFYAGRPLKSQGRNIGTLCVMDRKPRDFGEQHIRLLDQFAILIEEQIGMLGTIEAQNRALEARRELEESQRRLSEAMAELETEKARSDELLLHLLPANVARELQTRGRVQPVLHPDVAVMFADFTAFTQVTEQLSPEELVGELNECFCQFDWIASRHGVEKLKTVGDCFICAAGLNTTSPDDSMNLVRVALEIRDFVAERRAALLAAGRPCWDVRIGLHAGPLVAGIVGVRKFVYDIWGDTMNTAARIEASGEPGRINASETFLNRVKEHIAYTPRGKIPCKNKGEIEMAFIDAIIA
jgi:class 3 adenylate cyclase